jgi:hypothetical protein
MTPNIIATPVSLDNGIDFIDWMDLERFNIQRLQIIAAIIERDLSLILR